MKKLAILMIIITSLFLSGCRNVESYSQSNEANKILIIIIDALENDDSETIKELLAPDLLTQSNTIDEEIQAAFDYFDGNILSYKNVSTPAGEESYRNGNLTYSCIGNAVSKSIVTDTGVYKISFSAVLVNEGKKTQEGVWRIWIAKEDEDGVVIGTDNYDL